VALEYREESRSHHGKVYILTRLNFPRPRNIDLYEKAVVNVFNQDASARFAY
jgi:ribosomal protein S30